VDARVDEELDATLAALADPTRRRVVELLCERPRRAGELVEAFDVSAPAISRHLRVLRTRGLVEELRDEQDARLRIYRLKPDRFLALSGWLREVEAFWTDQLDAFKAYAESAERAGRIVRSAGAPAAGGSTGEEDGAA
jgi:DNA-binding transcriptional ArsR family regulator